MNGVRNKLVRYRFGVKANMIDKVDRKFWSLLYMWSSFVRSSRLYIKVCMRLRLRVEGIKAGLERGSWSVTTAERCRGECMDREQ